MFDFQQAKADREAEILAKQNADAAEQNDIDSRCLAICNDFTAFASRNGQAIQPSRTGNTVTLDTGTIGSMTILVLPDDEYRIDFRSRQGTSSLYQSLDDKTVNGSALPRKVIDWIYGA